MNRRHLLLATLGLIPMLIAGAAAGSDAPPGALAEVEAYAHAQGTTGLLIVQDGTSLVEKNWPLGAGSERFRDLMTYGSTSDGELLEDVASQQKSFIAVLLGIAADRNLLDTDRSVSSYIGAGWSRATPGQESLITVLNLLQMNSGLKDDLTYESPPGSRFFYNTPAYAILKRVLEFAARRTLDELTRDWLTEPLRMVNTSWKQRPAALPSMGNATGLVTTPRDEAAFGQMILMRGIGPRGNRVISEAQLQLLFKRSTTNPAYGRLWWLNGGPITIGARGDSKDGPLIRSAPTDLVAALGLFDRKLYVVPGARLVVVRLGQQATDRDFDEQFWKRLSSALGLTASAVGQR
jgi:CubicO group peptidase (beta-lactamase class C family)